jgi:hypothetical protein
MVDPASVSISVVMSRLFVAVPSVSAPSPFVVASGVTVVSISSWYAPIVTFVPPFRFASARTVVVAFDVVSSDAVASESAPSASASETTSTSAKRSSTRASTVTVVPSSVAPPMSVVTPAEIVAAPSASACAPRPPESTETSISRSNDCSASTRTAPSATTLTPLSTVMPVASVSVESPSANAMSMSDPLPPSASVSVALSLSARSVKLPSVVMSAPVARCADVDVSRLASTLMEPTAIAPPEMLSAKASVSRSEYASISTSPVAWISAYSPISTSFVDVLLAIESPVAPAPTPMPSVERSAVAVSTTSVASENVPAVTRASPSTRAATSTPVDAVASKIDTAMPPPAPPSLVAIA